MNSPSTTGTKVNVPKKPARLSLVFAACSAATSAERKQPSTSEAEVQLELAQCVSQCDEPSVWDTYFVSATTSENSVYRRRISRAGNEE